jgi:hypothetical protein
MDTGGGHLRGASGRLTRAKRDDVATVMSPMRGTGCGSVVRVPVSDFGVAIGAQMFGARDVSLAGWMKGD